MLAYIQYSFLKVLTMGYSLLEPQYVELSNFKKGSEKFITFCISSQQLTNNPLN